MKAKVTITRRSSKKGGGCVSIFIEDEASGLRIVDVEMELIEFAEAITGMGHCSAEYRFKPTDYTIKNIGKKREVKSIFVDKANVCDREKEKKIILKSINNSGELVDGWELSDDGTRSQQPGDKHKVNLRRFV